MRTEDQQAGIAGDGKFKSAVEEKPLIITLTFVQEIFICALFLSIGLLLLVFTEPGSFIAVPSPVNDVLLLLRAVINSILLLFIPGFALTNLLFMDPEKLDFIERIALSCGLSISLVILTGFVLASGEITAFSIYILIAFFTILFVLAKLTVIKIERSEKFQSKLQELKLVFASSNDES
ncbi:MAG: DUF1616 domain-containing protein [Candidatus Odinarchaeota archaeon]